MANMSYCRFRNTLQAVRDCYENMDNTDWCSRLVNLREDDHFTVTANVGIQRASPASGEAPLE